MNDIGSRLPRIVPGQDRSERAEELRKELRTLSKAVEKRSVWMRPTERIEILKVIEEAMK